MLLQGFKKSECRVSTIKHGVAEILRLIPQETEKDSEEPSAAALFWQHCYNLTLEVSAHPLIMHPPPHPTPNPTLSPPGGNYQFPFLIPTCLQSCKLCGDHRKCLELCGRKGV